MLVIRPVAPPDLDDLLELAGQATFGLTTLPRDADFLRQRIADSVEGFGRLGSGRPRGEPLLLVLEDTTANRVVGTAGVVSKVGGFEPFYAYAIETTVHESVDLGIYKEIRTLHLVEEHNGPSEIGSMFLHPSMRGQGAGRVLSLSRFLLIAEYPANFAETVIAEMRGVIDERGHSDFWDAVGKHFFDLDFPKADALSMTGKQFIGDLMPRHPIYIPLLPPAAQAVIGQVHQNTAPALRILQQEGFRFTGMVDIFEAGPIVSCPRDELRLVRTSQRQVVVATAPKKSGPATHLISTTDTTAFRCCSSSLEQTAEGVILPATVATSLGVTAGDAVRTGLIQQAPSKQDTPEAEPT